jgi:hypothetical protein
MKRRRKKTHREKRFAPSMSALKRELKKAGVSLEAEIRKVKK